MSCDGIFSLSPVCVATAAVNLPSSIADSAFSHMAGAFGVTAGNAASWLWQQLDEATALDLSSPALLTEIAATASVAVVLCLALFTIQVITGTLRRDPGALGRAFTGLVISFVGSALALGTTRIGLGAVDSLSAGFVQYTAGTNVAGLGSKLQFVALSNIQSPVTTLLFAVVIIAAVVVVWAAMMIRKMTLLIAAVLAPLAFSGATADITRSWARKWVELVCALVASKLLLVIILSIGVAVLDTAGQAGGGTGQATTQLAAGSLILMLGGFAPWASIKMFSFAGESLYAAHAAVGHAKAGGQAAIAAPQKAAALHGQVRAISAGSRASHATPPWAGGNQPTAAAVQTARPGVPGVGTAPAGEPGAAGAVGATGSAAAATGPAAPAIAVGTAAAGAVETTVQQAGVATQSATTAGPPGGPPPEPPPPPGTQLPPARGPQP
ncbi:type IV secretion system protein [Dermatophilaceae bacterium Soc4.6]